MDSNIREYMDVKFGMFADQVSDLTKQVRQLAEAVIKIATLEERQNSSDHTTDRRLIDIEERTEALEKQQTQFLIDAAKNRVYFIAGNFIATATSTALMAFIVKQLIR